MDIGKLWKEWTSGNQAPDLLQTPKALLDKSPDELTQELFKAIARNDLPRVKELREEGADLSAKIPGTLGAGTLIFSSNGDVSQPDGQISPLLLALYSGYYELGMYLANEKADATFERTEKDRYSLNNGKALDWVLSDHVREGAMGTRALMESMRSGKAFDKDALGQRDKDYKTDLYTTEQRLNLINAMLQHVENPMDLVSERTRYNAVNWGRADIIPKLAEMGVQFNNADFVQAGRPIHRRDDSLRTMQALLPYVENVNVTAYEDGENAGHEVARGADLPAFRWLEDNGLDKTALAKKTNIPSYAHRVAVADESPETLEFIKHLAKEGYSIDTSIKAVTGRSYGCNDTPVIAAIEEGNIASAVAFIDAGAKAPPEMLPTAVGKMHFNATRPPQVIAFIEALDERGLLNAAVLKASVEQIIYWTDINDKNLELMKPVGEVLVEKAKKLGVLEEIPFLPGESAPPPKGMGDGPGSHPA